MTDERSKLIDYEGSTRRWYDLFSRGARDWLRHNEKVSEAVRRQLPELISRSDVLGPNGATTLRVPVRFLEHYRFRLRNDDSPSGVGQGAGRPGDVLARPTEAEGETGSGQAGDGEGGYEYLLEFRIDDIVDWLWEKLELPHLESTEGQLQDEDYTREGWNRRGVRSRLDRRRSMKESIKRRSIHGDSPPFTDFDLRYRQLVARRQPTTAAVVIYAMDVSSSMSDEDRRLAKTFFFWAMQGLRRQYTQIESAFIAHTAEAWEFTEEEFFRVTATGGTVASTALEKALEIIDERYDPGRFNIYLFYASDGDNIPSDADATRAALRRITDVARFAGYVEIRPRATAAYRSQMGVILDELKNTDARLGAYSVSDADSVWDAIRGFFSRQAAEPGA